MREESNKAIHPCLSQHMPGAACADCSFKDASGYCQPWRNVAGKFNAYLKKKYSWRFNEDDRHDIISASFADILAGYRGIASMTAFPAWVWSILANKRDDALREQGRSGTDASCRIPSPPANIDDLAEKHKKYISWSNAEHTLRVVSSYFPLRVLRDLIDQANYNDGDDHTAEKWRRNLNRLHRYSRQPCFGELDGQEPGHGRTPEEKYDDAPEGAFFIKIFRAMKGKQAENCVSLFQDLIRHDHDRRWLAQSHSQTDDALKQQISRCIRLCRKGILRILSRITTSEGEFCFSFLAKLFESGDGVQKRIDNLASASGVSGGEIMTSIRRCRLLALKALEECHA